MTVQITALLGPRHSASIDTITSALLASGPMTERELKSITGELYSKPSRYRAALRRCVESGLFEEVDGKYGISAVGLNLIAPKEAALPVQKGEVAGPRYFANKPWSGKYSLSTAARRNDAPPAREISFVSCSGGEFRVLGDRP